MSEVGSSVTAVLPSLAGGGAERVCLNLILGLQRRGVDVRLVLLNDRGPLRAILPDGLPVTSLGHDRLRTGIMPLIRHLRRNPSEFVFSTLRYVNMALAVLRSAFPGKLVLREANMPTYSMAEGPFQGISAAVYGACYRRADLVLASSVLMRQKLLDLGLTGQRVALLRNPVDIVELRRTAESTRPAIRYVAAGRLTRQKGFDRLIPMLARIDNASLTILGDGADRDFLEQLAIREGLPLHMPGFVPDAPAWYAAADVLLLPSRWEGMPNVVLEALACGTPVIATPEAGGIQDLADAVPEAVTVVDFGDDFRRAVEAAPAKGRSGLRPSLLPRDYELESVVTLFLSVLGKL